MSMRRMFQVGVIALALGGTFAPMVAPEAQVTGTDRTTTTRDDDRGGIDFGWIGVIGLAGLAGLMGNRRESPGTGRHTSATSTAVPR